MKWSPVGGTGDGPRTSPRDIARAKRAIAGMPTAEKFDRIHKGKTVVIVGNSESATKMDLSSLARFPIISCNRVLKPWKRGGMPRPPDYIMMGDREPYCQERDAGRLAEFVKNGGVFLGTDSLFDPSVRLRGPYINHHRRAQPPPDFTVHIYKIGTAGTRQPMCSQGVKFFPMAMKSFRERFESCQNVAGSMIQAAAAMGAKRILSVGIDLKWRKLNKDDKNDTASTFEGQCGQHSQRKSIPYTLACFRWAKGEFKKKKITLYNLSPVKDSKFAEVWGNYPIKGIKEEWK